MTSYWERISAPRHIDPKTYVAKPAGDQVFAFEPTLSEEFVQRPNAEVECPTCGEWFIPVRSAHLFCSKKCQKHQGMVTVKCAQCGKAFETQDSDRRKYCEMKCLVAAKRKASGDKTCEGCGVGFHTSQKVQRFCSRDCYNDDRRAKKEAAA